MELNDINKLNPSSLCDKMVEISEFCRVNNNNFLLLEAIWPDCDNHFLMEGIQLIVDGTEYDVLLKFLEIRLQTYIGDHHKRHFIQKILIPHSFYDKITCLKIIKTALEEIAQKSNPRIVLHFCKAHINRYIDTYDNSGVKLKY
ncbi:MAG: hypothetical protein COA79_17610 [Planctomycetota bacterium]|nr:MAG: hypothetical protein COA79_17610 [Planctomycetota bacterium]